MTEPTTLKARATSTTTTHRQGCERPGWQLETSRTMRGLTIARCAGCGAVELRTEGNR